MTRKNAVEKRLDVLHDQWTEFAQLPEARLLRWVVETDEVRMVEAFLEKESDENIGECPDLFLQFDTPFEDPSSYGGALYKSLEALVEESRAGMEAEGLGGWSCPPLAPGGANPEAFLRACGELRDGYESLCEHLAVVLMPERVTDTAAWRTWLSRAVAAARWPHVRLVVLDDARTRALEPLAQAFPEKVVSIPARLDMGKALEELSQEAGNLDSPGGRFRELFVQMSNASMKGAVAKVESLGAQAVALAAGQGWFHLVVTAHFVMGGALLGVKRPREAIGHYEKAEAAALEALAHGETQQGATLRLKSRLSQGAALVMTQEEFPRAAALYEETAPLARELEDARMELECWRMASWCREMAQEMDKAWELGQRAWEVGRSMDAQTRGTSTLPYVGEALVRLGQERQGERGAREAESRVEALLGKDWRPKATAEGQPS